MLKERREHGGGHHERAKRRRFDQVFRPVQAVALHRLMVAESARFPELAEVLAREGSMQEAIALIAGLLERDAKTGRLEVAEPAFAAQHFLQMVIALPQRRAVGLGAPMSRREIAEWPRKVVDLFLYGCRRDTQRS